MVVRLAYISPDFSLFQGVEGRGVKCTVADSIFPLTVNLLAALDSL